MIIIPSGCRAIVNEAMFNTEYSIECMSVMIDLSSARIIYNGDLTPLWLVNLLLHDLAHCEVYDAALVH